MPKGAATSNLTTTLAPFVQERSWDRQDRSIMRAWQKRHLRPRTWREKTRCPGGGGTSASMISTTGTSAICAVPAGCAGDAATLYALSGYSLLVVGFPAVGAAAVVSAAARLSAATASSSSKLIDSRTAAMATATASSASSTNAAASGSRGPNNKPAKLWSQATATQQQPP